MRVIVCGLDSLALELVRFLRAAGEDVVVVAPDATLLGELDGPAPRCVTGDPRDPAALAAAGIAEADALFALDGDDARNLETCLHAKSANPGLRIVTRLFYEEISDPLTAGLGLASALSTSSLAAPVFTAACLGGEERATFAWRGTAFLLGARRIEPGSARTTAGSMAAACGVASVRLIRPEEEPCPPAPDRELLPGDEVLFLAPHETAAGRARRQGGWRRIFNVPRRVRTLALGYLALVLLAMGVFHASIGLKWVDALYFTVTTTTTVGYGDFNLQAAPDWVKLFGSLVMLGGACFLAALFSIVTDVLLGSRLDRYFGLAKSKQHGHVVVAGLGKIGWRVADAVDRRGVDVCALERDDQGRFFAAARGRFPVFTGDAALRETLERAGVARAACVAALTDDDLVNLAIILQARAVNPLVRVVARAVRAPLAKAFRESFGADAVLSTAALAMPAIAAAAAHARARFAFPVAAAAAGKPDILVLLEIPVCRYPELAGLDAATIAARWGLAIAATAVGDGAARPGLPAPLTARDTVLLAGGWAAARAFPER